MGSKPYTVDGRVEVMAEGGAVCHAVCAHTRTHVRVVASTLYCLCFALRGLGLAMNHLHGRMHKVA